MAIGDFGLLSKFISFAISHVKKYLFSNISRKHATTKLSFIFGKIRLNESEIRRFSFQKCNNRNAPAIQNGTTGLHRLRHALHYSPNLRHGRN